MYVYDLMQTTFLFSMVSNAACMQSGSRQELAEFLTLAVGGGGEWKPAHADAPIEVNGFLAKTGQQLIGQDWSIVWGPGICVRQGKRAQNAMVVVHSVSQDTYVVAIAGTNMNSYYDWLVEDALVGESLMAPFPVRTGAVAPKPVMADADLPQVSLGTAIGINNLTQHMYDASGMRIHLEEFLGGLRARSGARIIFTGHSLGGALSSTLAAQVLPVLHRNWIEQGGQVLVLPTAGPSPGNSAFARYWGGRFPPVDVPVNAGNRVNQLNVLCWDTQDVVPHAWDFLVVDDRKAVALHPNLSVPYFVYQATGFLSKNVQTQLGELLNRKVKDTESEDGKKWDLKKVRLPWVTATLELMTKLQAIGTAANMCRLPHNRGYTGRYPITCWSPKKSQWEQYSGPENNVFRTAQAFGKAAAAVHVWQYYQFFDIKPEDVVRPTSG